MPTLPFRFLILTVMFATLASHGQATRHRRRDAEAGSAVAPPAAPSGSTAANAFAPMPAGHPLADLWNDPEFTRRLLGSYGFLSEAEPRLSPEEQVIYREKVVPLLREDPRKAIPLLTDLAKPGASAVFDYTLATLHFQHEDFTNAVRYYEQAIAKFPDYRRAHRNLGLALVRDGRYEDAIKPLTRTIALGGADGRILGLLGFAHLNANRLVSAAASYQQAMVFEPENFDFKLGLVKAQLGLNNLDAASALLDELLRQHPDKEVLWALQANVFVQKEMPDKAIVNLEILRRMEKATPQQLTLLGDLHISEGYRALALEAYLAAVAKDGGADPTRGLRPAEILISRGAFPEARALLERVRALGTITGPDELRVLKLEARIALATDRAEEGIRSLEELLVRAPLDGEAILLAGDYYARHGEPEKAELRYDAAAKLEGYEPDALLKLAQLKVQQLKYTEAVELLRRAQRIRPRDNVARYLERVEQVAARSRS